MVMVVTMSK